MQFTIKQIQAALKTRKIRKNLVNISDFIEKRNYSDKTTLEEIVEDFIKYSEKYEQRKQEQTETEQRLKNEFELFKQKRLTIERISKLLQILDIDSINKIENYTLDVIEQELQQFETEQKVKNKSMRKFE